MSVDRVWYASYGSNLLAERFALYLSGGAMAGHTIGHHGARDAGAAGGSRPWRIPHRLCFGGVSERWGGGGVAFVDAEPGSGQAIVRLWDVTAEQFDDVAAQENRMVPGELRVDHAALRAAGHLDVTERWYGRVLWCGEVDGRPVLTFTRREPIDVSPPGPAYLSVVGRGLVECGLTGEEAVAYLLGADGVAHGWSAAAIAELIGAG